MDKLGVFYLVSAHPDDIKIVDTVSGPLNDDIVQRARLFLENLGLKLPSANTYIHFLTPEDMDKKDSNADGMCHQRMDGAYDIFVRCGQTYVYTKSVVAHELGHTWLIEKNIRLSEKESEGFCQLLSWQILASDFNLVSNQEMKKLEEWADEVYGDGFRLMKAKVESLGWPQLLSLLKTQF